MFPEYSAENESDVGRPFAETAREIRKPLPAERNIDANAVAFLRERALQIPADAVQHLEFEPVWSNAVVAGDGFRLLDERRVVGRQRGIVPSMSSVFISRA